MGAKMSVLRLIISFPPYLSSAMVRFPLLIHTVNWSLKIHWRTVDSWTRWRWQILSRNLAYWPNMRPFKKTSANCHRNVPIWGYCYVWQIPIKRLVPPLPSSKMGIINSCHLRATPHILKPESSSSKPSTRPLHLLTFVWVQRVKIHLLLR